MQSTISIQQQQTLEAILFSSPVIRKLLALAPALELPDYYIGAGCITQTVWNHLFGLPYHYGIKDVDFVYFDPHHLDYEAEHAVIQKVQQLYQSLPLPVDVKNQARVHLWYSGHFGYSIPPYLSLEKAIDTWPTTATAIGVRQTSDGHLSIYAPFGLKDLLNKTVRANKVQITQEIYEKKVTNWLTKWPDLTVIPWDEC